MTSPCEPENTHDQGCGVVLAGILVLLGFIYFDAAHQGMLAAGGLMALGGTAVIRRDLIKRLWFQLFAAIVAVGHVALVVLNPGQDFSRGGYKLFVLADLLLVLGLLYLVEKIVIALRRAAN